MISEIRFRIKKDGTPYKNCLCRNPELIENYDQAIADNTQIWVCHHRLELIATGAVVDATVQDLIDWGIYYDRPADELIFLMNKDHAKLHSEHNYKWTTLGYKHTEEAKVKISEASRGRKHGPLTEETRAKISAAHKGKKRGPMSEEQKKKLSAAHKGKLNSEESKQKMSEARKGKHWKLVDGKRVWY